MPEPKLLCAHCSEVCVDAAVYSEGMVFCCKGCETVYAILAENNLCDYYSIAENPGVSMRRLQRSDDEYAALDEPPANRQFLTFESASRNRAVWTIPTLHCASCVWLLEQLDRFDSGVWSSSVDIMRKQITIDYDPRTTSLRKLAELLASIGYAPLVRLEDGRTESGEKALNRGLYMRIGIAGFAAGNTMMMYISRYFAGEVGVGAGLAQVFSILAIVLSVPVLVYCASPWWTGVRAAWRRKKITLDVPVAIGIAVLFGRSILDIGAGTSEGYLDSFNGLVFFLLIGRLFQQKAFDALSFDRTYRSFFPLSVRVERSSGESVIAIERVQIGDVLSVRNGEVIPCDSILQSQSGYVDYSFVTGESQPVECTEATTVYAGGRVVGRALRLIAIKPVSHSELARMWDRTSTRKPRMQFVDLSDQFGEWFTGLAIAIAVAAGTLWLPDWVKTFNVFTAVLIIACPCALTLAAPITLGSAMGRLGSFGIFLKNIGVILELDCTDTICFDKTGTLTTPNASTEWNGRTLTESEWSAVRAVASQSGHPMSRAISSAYQVSGIGYRTSSADNVTQVQEAVGRGIHGKAFDHAVAIGSHEFVTGYCPDTRNPEPDTRTAVAIDGHYAGSFSTHPNLRDGIPQAIAELKNSKRVALISGDGEHDRDLLAPLFGEASISFRQSPEQKTEAIAHAQAQGHTVLMVGDGLNDAGAMSTADVAIAVTDDTATLVPACDVIMRANTVHMLPLLLRYAHTMKLAIWVSLIFSIIYNALGLTLATLGQLAPMIAAILMPVSSLTVIAISVGSARIAARRFRWA